MKKRVPTDIIGWFFCYLLAATLPLVSHYARNYQMFSWDQLLVSAGFILGVAALFFTIYACAWCWILRRIDKGKGFPFALKTEWLRPLGLAAGVAFVYWRFTAYSGMLSLRPHVGGSTAAAVAIFGFLFFVYTAIAYRFHWKGTLWLLLAAVAVQGGGGIYMIVARNQSEEQIQPSTDVKAIYDAVRFAATPNVYFIVLEAYHGMEWMKKFYEVDNCPFATSLEKMGFSVYSNCFANYLNTASSLHSVFLMKHHYYLLSAGNADSHGTRRFIAGGSYNPVLAILKNNGYHINYLLGDDYAYSVSIARRNIDRLLIRKGHPLQALAPLILPLRVSRGAMAARDYRALLLETCGAIHRERSPQFVFMKTGLEHAPLSWPPADSFQDTYRALIEPENRFLLDLCSTITQQDPDAIVILMGDHGAFGYSSGWQGREENPNAFLAQQAKDIPSAIADCADVFLAIKLGTKPSEKLPVRSLVNIFRELFFFLSGDQRILATRVPDDTYGYQRNRIFRLVDHGRVLGLFDLVNPEELARKEAPP